MDVQAVHMNVLVQALTLVLTSRELTADDKRHVSSLLDAEVAELVATGDEAPGMTAKAAVKEAVKKHRRMQGVASREARKREEKRRGMKTEMAQLLGQRPAR
jgi:hypothetical protein